MNRLEAAMQVIHDYYKQHAIEPPHIRMHPHFEMALMHEAPMQYWNVDPENRRFMGIKVVVTKDVHACDCSAERRGDQS